MKDTSFQGRLSHISYRCRGKLGIVVPWELLLAIFTMIVEYCQGLESPEEFCRKAKQPGPFAKWVLWWKVDRVVRQYDRLRRLPYETVSVVLDELFATAAESSEQELRSFHGQLTAVMRGEEPPEG